MGNRAKWEGWAWSFHQFGERLLRMTAAHLMWVVCTFMGGIVFGIFPATAALYDVLSGKWNERGLFSAFWHAFRHYFWRSHWLGWGMALTGAILWVDVVFFLRMGSIWGLSIAAVFAGIGFLHAATTCHAFSLLVREDADVKRTLKQSFWLVAAFPLHSLVTMGGLLLLLIFMLAIPVLPILLGASLPVWWMNARMSRLLEKRDRKRSTKQPRGETYAV
ncbi:YesL family protein [Brevibacillus formosus]|uniref:YesL family protein n=1 Tax=Brevibacillus formosus TaxID=54913 RepID=UPI003F1D8774